MVLKAELILLSSPFLIHDKQNPKDLISQRLGQIWTVFGLSPQVGSSAVASVRKGRTSWSTFGMSTHQRFSNKGDSGVPSLSVSLPHILTMPRIFCRSYWNIKAVVWMSP